MLAAGPEKYGYVANECDVEQPPMDPCAAGGSLFESGIRVPESRTFQAVMIVDVFVTWAPDYELGLDELARTMENVRRLPRAVGECTRVWHNDPLPPIDLGTVSECIFRKATDFFEDPPRGLLVAKVPVSFVAREGHLYVANNYEDPDAFHQREGRVVLPGDDPVRGPRFLVAVALPMSAHI